MKIPSLVQAILLGCFAAWIAGCASAPRAEYPQTANPAEELARLAHDINTAEIQQYDVIAPDDLRKAQANLKEAQEELADQGSLEEFWEDMSESRGYLNRAQVKYDRRSAATTELLSARMNAVNAGARRFEKTRNELEDIDDEFRKLASRMDDRGYDMREMEELRREYHELEVNSTQASKIGEARKLIEKAEDDGARRLAPRSLKFAQDTYFIANRAIAENVGNERAYAADVDRANRAARTLTAVFATARQASGQSNEEVARQIVARNQALSSIEGELQGAELEATLANRELAGRDAELRAATVSNAALLTEADWNAALEDARSEFTEDEAEVYRQGDKLLIRLKQVQFPSGSAELPEQSKPLLTKVTSVIDELNASNVEIQGHTDSTGAPQVNKSLSTKRAQAVAEFMDTEVDAELKPVGYGYDRPLVTNKTKEGRAMNRRVDIVITPARDED